MARVLILNTTQWGRGITPIWIASHTGILRNYGHTVELCDLNFLSKWSKFEVDYNQDNNQYLETPDYLPEYSTVEPAEFLLSKIIDSSPDIIIWSAISSHIHGEGEFSSLERGYDFISSVLSDVSSTSKIHLVASGVDLLSYQNSKNLSELFPSVSCFIFGDSEYPLIKLCSLIDSSQSLPDRIVSSGKRIKLSKDYLYDYSLFDQQSFLRPYHGSTVKAVDYEFARGCPYSCAYCVETSIQDHYKNDEGRTIFKDYYSSKSSSAAFEELNILYKQGVSFIRVQDTNFMSLGRAYIEELADMLQANSISLKFYIETRPESIDSTGAKLLSYLGVCGVGMGVETASDEMRSAILYRYCNSDKITNAFRLLRDHGISRTSYNMIGLPGESSDSIIDTIKLNRTLQPDDITCAYFTPYNGTPLKNTVKNRPMIDSSQYDPQLEYPFSEPNFSSFYRKLKHKFPYLCKNTDSLDWIRDEFPAQ